MTTVNSVQSAPAGGSLATGARPAGVSVAHHRGARPRLLREPLFAFTVTFTAIGLSTRISFAKGHLASTRLLILDYPLPFGASLVAAAASWAAYSALRRRYTAT